MLASERQHGASQKAAALGFGHLNSPAQLQQQARTERGFVCKAEQLRGQCGGYALALRPSLVVHERQRSFNAASRGVCVRLQKTQVGRREVGGGAEQAVRMVRQQRVGHRLLAPLGQPVGGKARGLPQRRLLSQHRAQNRGAQQGVAEQRAEASTNPGGLPSGA